MALQLGIRRAGLTSYNYGVSSSLASKSVGGGLSSTVVAGRRWKSTDAGDVIGIDLGTTNSCVATMVSGCCCCSRDVHVIVT